MRARKRDAVLRPVEARASDARACVAALRVAEDAGLELRMAEHPGAEQRQTMQPLAPLRPTLNPDARKRLVSALADVVLADLLRYARLP